MADLPDAPTSRPAKSSFDEQMDEQTLRERDQYHAIADELAELIARITGVQIGEHSSMNCPWENALQAGTEYAERYGR